MTKWNGLHLTRECPNCGGVLQISPSLDMPDFAPLSSDIDDERLVTTAVGLVMRISCTNAGIDGPACNYRVDYHSFWSCDAQGARLVPVLPPVKYAGHPAAVPAPGPDTVPELTLFEGLDGRRAVVFRDLGSPSINPRLRVRYEQHPDHFDPASPWFLGRVAEDQDTEDRYAAHKLARDWVEGGVLPEALP